MRELLFLWYYNFALPDSNHNHCNLTTIDDFFSILNLCQGKTNTSGASKNDSRKLGHAKMGAETKARLSLSKASAQDTVQTKGMFFFVKAFKGLAICEKPLTKRL